MTFAELVLKDLTGRVPQGYVADQDTPPHLDPLVELYKKEGVVELLLEWGLDED